MDYTSRVVTIRRRRRCGKARDRHEGSGSSGVSAYSRPANWSARSSIPAPRRGCATWCMAAAARARIVVDRRCPLMAAARRRLTQHKATGHSDHCLHPSSRNTTHPSVGHKSACFLSAARTRFTEGAASEAYRMSSAKSPPAHNDPRIELSVWAGVQRRQCCIGAGGEP